MAANPIEGRVLVLPSTRADGLAMSKVFGANRIAFGICSSMSQLCAAQREGSGLLVICEEAVLADAPELATCLDGQPVWSDLPILVLSRSGRESNELGELVARLGNVSVVERPIRTSTLLSLVRSSLRARKRQYQVREYLSQQEHVQQMIRASVESERAAREEAERTSRTKDEFLATLSHELRTPLNAVLGWAQVLRKSYDLSDDVMNGLAVIERNARAQAKIIGELLDMSSILSGKVYLDVQRLDVASLINATIETIRPIAQAKNIRLQVVIDPMAASVAGDSNRLQQVFWNLLTNAVKFTRHDGSISITLTRAKSHIEIEVADNGEGIEPEFLPHVFDRFRQADSSHTRRHGGLGLGLSIVKQLVELHGGSVTAKSAGHDLGSTFRITLPVVDAVHDPSEIARHHSTQSAAMTTLDAGLNTDLSGVKVLVVDDEPDARSLLQRVLQDRNARVTMASSADEAMRALMQEAPDILISDIGMPGEDGYMLMRRIRTSSNARSTIPSIALTAYAHTKDRVRAINAGFQAHVSKPIEPAELVAAVGKLVGRSVADNGPEGAT